MSFPVQLISNVQSHNGNFNRNITLHKGLTVFLGPNGSGKTHLLHGLKQSLSSHTNGKKVRFLSAGRMGLLEQYRSDFDGQRGGGARYDEAQIGSKNDTNRRHQMETINGDFQTLSVRADILIKVQERLKKLFKRDLLLDWDGGHLKVSFARLDTTSLPYSSGREASGLMHLVGILSALYDDEVGALLLDEPEVSLHPQLQAFLLKEIINVSGHPSEGSNKKIIVIATHSTEMVKIERSNDLLSLVFCYDLNDEPIQINPTAGELSNRKIQGLIARLGQEHKLALFSKRPLLVEGPSDVMICSTVASKIDMHLEAAGSQLLPVIGKGEMPVVVKLLQLLGKEPVILADADGIADSLDLVNAILANNIAADAKATRLGSSSATNMASSIYNDFCKLVSEKWGDISSVAEQHPYWINRNQSELEQAKRRASFCTIFTLDNVQFATFDTDGQWIKIKARFTSLLELLEDVGCFILRKGSIESYYQKADKFTSIGKPSAAADEIDYISQILPKLANDVYGDIVRCIKYAANAERICEAESLRDLLLAVSAPAFAKMQSGGTTQDIQMIARSIVGDRSKLFGFNVSNSELTITLESKILEVNGFPLILNKVDDLIKKVNATLAIS